MLFTAVVKVGGRWIETVGRLTSRITGVSVGPPSMVFPKKINISKSSKITQNIYILRKNMLSCGCYASLGYMYALRMVDIVI